MAHSHNAPVKLDGFQQSVDPTKEIVGYTTSGSFTSAPIKVGRKTGYSMTLSCPATGSPVGNVSIEICNDEERALDVADETLVNWLPVDDGDEDLSGASIICLEDREPKYRWMRIVYTRSSGSITATINLHLKQESALKS